MVKTFNIKIEDVLKNDPELLRTVKAVMILTNLKKQIAAKYRS